MIKMNFAKFNQKIWIKFYGLEKVLNGINKIINLLKKSYYSK